MLDDAERRCFACGPANPIGLHLTFREAEDAYLTEFVPAPEHQGYDGVVHGGLVATVLDEVMARWLWAQGLPFATAELTVRYLAPARIGGSFTVRATTTKRSARLIELEAEMVSEEGQVVARAKGRFLPVRGGFDA